jgi:hypothetical protein
MNSSPHIESGTLAGTVVGTALCVVADISSPDVIRTVILATIGAVVSFTVSLLLKRLTKK